MLRIPKGQRIEERFWSLISKLQRPVLARVGRLVDARGRSVSDAEQPGGLAIQRFDITEVEFLRAWHLPNVPDHSGIRRAKECPFGPGRPRDLAVHRTETAQIRFGSGHLSLPLRVTE